MSTKKHIIAGKDFYIFNEIFEEEKGDFIKFFQPVETKISTHNSSVREVEVCISKETWKELSNKIKSLKDKEEEN